MIAIDTNLLVYAHRRDAVFHNAAARVVTSLAESNRAWSVPWPCIHEFIAVVTHSKVYRPPSTLEEACRQVDAWLKAPTLSILCESAGYWAVLQEVLAHGQVTGPRVHDARVAALCQVHGVRELWSADRDFTRFPALKVRNPL